MTSARETTPSKISYTLPGLLESIKKNAGEEVGYLFSTFPYNLHFSVNEGRYFFIAKGKTIDVSTSAQADWAIYHPGLNFTDHNSYPAWISSQIANTTDAALFELYKTAYELARKIHEYQLKILEKINKLEEEEKVQEEKRLYQILKKDSPVSLFNLKEKLSERLPNADLSFIPENLALSEFTFDGPEPTSTRGTDLEEWAKTMNAVCIAKINKTQRKIDLEFAIQLSGQEIRNAQIRAGQGKIVAALRQMIDKKELKELNVKGLNRIREIIKPEGELNRGEARQQLIAVIAAVQTRRSTSGYGRTPATSALYKALASFEKHLDDHARIGIEADKISIELPGGDDTGYKENSIFKSLVQERAPIKNPRAIEQLLEIINNYGTQNPIIQFVPLQEEPAQSEMKREAEHKRAVTPASRPSSRASIMGSLSGRRTRLPSAGSEMSVRDRTKTPDLSYLQDADIFDPMKNLKTPLLEQELKIGLKSENENLADKDNKIALFIAIELAVARNKDRTRGMTKFAEILGEIKYDDAKSLRANYNEAKLQEMIEFGAASATRKVFCFFPPIFRAHSTQLIYNKFAEIEKQSGGFNSLTKQQVTDLIEMLDDYNLSKKKDHDFIASRNLHSSL